MHYSIQQDLARDHHDALLREASRAHLAALTRDRRIDENASRRVDPLRSLIRRLHLPRARAVPAH